MQGGRLNIHQQHASTHVHMHTHIQTHARIHTFGVAKSMSFQLKATWDGKSFLIGLLQLNDGVFCFVLYFVFFPTRFSVKFQKPSWPNGPEDRGQEAMMGSGHFYCVGLFLTA